MKVEFISTACILIFLKNGKSILCDPWIGGSAYYGSWFKFPPIPQQLLERYTGLDPDFIYVSHIHPDHFHPETLISFNKNIPLLILKRKAPQLRNQLASLGFKYPRDGKSGNPKYRRGRDDHVFGLCVPSGRFRIIYPV